MGADRSRGGIGIDALHVAGLWALAVAQPLYDVVSRSPEFFVAHDARPAHLVALVLALGLIGPAACVVLIAAARRLGPRWDAVTSGVVIGALSGTIALAAMRAWGDWSGEPTLAAATAVAFAAGTGYVRAAPIRLFATFLSPAAVIVPVAFLLQPAITPLLSPPDTGRGPIDGVTFESTPPVVFIVFDQLPLVSLLDRAGAIDPTRYPHFAALAGESTWFRNASAVSPTTRFALPAILTGRYPVPDDLPTVDDYPENLFTLLGSRYRLEVIEPLTGLCPPSLCPVERAGVLAWLGAVMRDLRIVWLQTVLPDDLTRSLPPVTQTWANFAENAGVTFQEAWSDRRRDDRRNSVERFLAGLDRGARGGRPALHFLHLLLPHEPWLHLPTGQRFSLQPRLIGLERGERWTEDVDVIALNYRRHLLQVGYVDTVLGAIVQRMRDTGMYDDALLVVTSDHGAGFRPGHPFRRPRETSFADVGSVPLLIKEPGQRTGRVRDTNVETSDALPTVAAALGTALPWEADGTDALAADWVERPVKTMFLFDGTRRMEGPADLGEQVAAAVDWKYTLVDAGDPLRAAGGAAYDQLVGEPVNAHDSGTGAAFEATMDFPELLDAVDPAGDFVPAELTGHVAFPAAGPDDPSLTPSIAVALNGVVAAVTRPHTLSANGLRAVWDVLVDPELLQPGVNALGIYGIREAADGRVVLDDAYRSAAGDVAAAGTSGPNLVSGVAEELYGVTLSGFYGPDWAGTEMVRWTDGNGLLTVPIDPGAPPATLTVEVAMTNPTLPQRLRIVVDGCDLFTELVWGRRILTFGLEPCGIGGSTLEIAISTVPFRRAPGSRMLGVALARVALGN